MGFFETSSERQRLSLVSPVRRGERCSRGSGTSLRSTKSPVAVMHSVKITVSSSRTFPGPGCCKRRVCARRSNGLPGQPGQGNEQRNLAGKAERKCKKQSGGVCRAGVMQMRNRECLTTEAEIARSFPPEERCSGKSRDLQEALAWQKNRCASNPCNRERCPRA